jgi:antagonist of KipI
MIVVERAARYVTVQDAGRFAYRSSGVPQAGAMDQWSFAVANLLAGNHRNAATLEWAVGGGSLRFERDAIISLVGAEITATIDEKAIGSPGSMTVGTGQLLRIHGITARRFLYVAVRGGLDCPLVLGSRSTYLPASFGGVDGRRLVTGDVLTIGATTADADVRSDAVAVTAGGPDYDAETVRVIPRASDEDAETLTRFFENLYSVSAASDRTGYRLESARPLDGARASITSEPVCAGTIQLTPSGQPIVLMADAPTIGGYRILGTVISCDLPIVAQSLPGRTLRFERVSVDEAQALLEQRERALTQLVTAASARP